MTSKIWGFHRDFMLIYLVTLVNMDVIPSLTRWNVVDLFMKCGYFVLDWLYNIFGYLTILYTHIHTVYQLFICLYIYIWMYIYIIVCVYIYICSPFVKPQTCCFSWCYPSVWSFNINYSNPLRPTAPKLHLAALFIAASAALLCWDLYSSRREHGKVLSKSWPDEKTLLSSRIVFTLC
jgi:hypothetical protein